MTDTVSEIEQRRFPWARMRFELIGVAIAIGAWLAGILLGILWGPLFWIGAAGAVITLMATRQSERTPPNEAETIVSPVDGVVVSIEPGLPPVELRLHGQSYQRIRVSSSPSAMNGLHAPIAGEIASVVTEEGEPSSPFANSADGEGNAILYLTFGSDRQSAGVVVVAGGFGPRIDLDLEAGDVVRLGRKVGARRLGGWCDIWIPADLTAAIWPGMRLSAAETILITQGVDVDAGTLFRSEDTVVDADIIEEASTPEESDLAEDTQDPTEMFAKLRKKVSEAGKTVGEDAT